LKQTGTHIITEELTLKDFTWEVDAITIRFNEDRVSIEVLFNDSEESRSFDYETSDPLTKQECIDYLLTLSQFKGSV